MTTPAEQITHQEVDGDILPPDPATLPKDDPNAPHFEPFRNRDKLLPDVAPYVETEESESETAGEVGMFAVSSSKPEIPEDVRAELKAFRDRHPSASRSTDERHITLFHARGRGSL